MAKQVPIVSMSVITTASSEAPIVNGTEELANISEEAASQ